MKTNDELALDGTFVGHNRLWVSTYRLAEDYFQTIEYGPGARPEVRPRLYLTEEEALAGHDAVLASYDYRKTGPRKWKWFRSLEFTGRGIVNVSRRPISRKSVWIMAAFWAFGLLMAVAGIFMSRGGWSLWTNLVIGALDAYMLYQCIMGLLWSYNFPREGRRRRESDTLAG